MVYKPTYEELQQKTNELEKEAVKLKRTVKALQESDDRFRNTADMLPAVIMEYDLNGTLTYVNRYGRELGGYDREELEGFHILQVIVPEEHEKHYERVKRMIQGEEISSTEFRLLRKDGSDFWGYVTSNLIRKDGKVAGVRTCAIDITENKQAEEALMDETIRRRILVEQSRDGIVVLDQNGKVNEANQRFADMLGYSMEEVYQLHVWDWDARWTKEQLLEMEQTIDDTGDHFETRLRRKDGATCDVEISTNGAVYGGQKLIFCVCRDITDRKQAEAALRKSERKYRDIFENVSDFLYFHDLEGYFIETNNAAKQDSGYSEDDLANINIKDLIPERYRHLFDNYLNDVVEKGKSEGLIRVLAKDGSEHILEYRNSLVCDATGPIGIRGSARDITERKQVERALQISEERLRTLFESAQDFIFIKDCNRKYIEVNPSMEQLFGIPSSKLIGKTDDELFGEKAGTHIKEIDLRVLNGEIIKEEDTKPVGGRTLSFHVIKAPLRDASGEIIGLCGIARDITERKQAEEMLKKAHDELEKRVQQRTAELLIVNEKLREEIEEHKRTEKALRQSEERYRTFMNSTSDIAFLKDEQFRHIIVNKAYSKYLDREEREILGKTDFELLPTMLAEECRRSDHTAIESNDVIVSEEWDGERFYETRKFPVSFGDKIVGVGGYVREVTERKRSEEALIASEKKYSTVVENTKDGIAIISDGELKFVNKASMEMLGYSHRDMINVHFLEYIAPDYRDLVIGRYADRLEGKDVPSIYEIELRKKNGKTIPVELNVILIDYIDNPSHLIFIRDITERKQAEKALQKAHDELEQRVKERTISLKNKTSELQEMNAAMNVLLKKRDEDRKVVEEQILTNMKKLIFPYIANVKKGKLSVKQRTFINVIELNLKEIISPFSFKLSSSYFGLTPTEIEVADFVRQGKKSKEIAELLNISYRTIGRHRENIRKKIGIQNKKINLQSHLLSIH